MDSFIWTTPIKKIPKGKDRYTNDNSNQYVFFLIHPVFEIPVFSISKTGIHYLIETTLKIKHIFF